GRELPGPWTAADKRFTAIAFSPDSAVLAAAVPGGPGSKAKAQAPAQIVLWNLADGKPLQTLTHDGQPARALVFSPDGKTLQSASDGAFRWWDLDTGKEERTWKPFANETQPAKGDGVKTKTFSNCVLSPDGKFAAVQVGWRMDGKDDLDGEAKKGPVDYEAFGLDLTKANLTWRAHAKALQGNK